MRTDVDPDNPSAFAARQLVIAHAALSDPARGKLLLDERIALLAPRAREKGLALQQDIAADVPEVVSGDAARLAQTLTNLLGNAIKFTSSGEVELTVRVAPGEAGRRCLQFEVRDTGIGIAPEALPSIFDEYHRVEVPRQGTSRGLGLGLAIVKRLTELLGHDIEVSPGDNAPGPSPSRSSSGAPPCPHRSHTKYARRTR